MTMRIGLGAIQEVDDERLRFASQLGVTDIIANTHPVPDRGGYWDFQDLVWLRTRVETAGLRLYAIENVPASFYDKILEGKPGRDEQIEKMRITVRNMGRARIPVLGYHFMQLSVWRTGYNPVGRGGARVTVYDHSHVQNAPAAADAPVTDEMMWERLSYFLKGVVPVAEEEGVMLALHPDDPPMANIAGVARIIRSVEAYKRVMDIVPSPGNGIEFCQGTIAEMCASADEVYEVIRYFGSRRKIAYVHFRNVSRGGPSFEETFIDDGYVDMLQAMRAYYEVGFEGVLIPDHTPEVVGDTPYGHRGRAYAIGYMKGMLKAIGYYERGA
jgi:mannonate dehydratase